MRSNSFHLFRLQIGSITESSSRVREVITGVELLSTLSSRFDYAVACVAKGNKGACDREGRLRDIREKGKCSLLFLAGPCASATQFHARVKVARNQHCWFGVVFSDQQCFYF